MEEAGINLKPWQSMGRKNSSIQIVKLTLMCEESFLKESFL